MKSLCVFTLYSENGPSSQYRAYIFKSKFEKQFDVKFYNFWTDKYTRIYMYDKKKYLFHIVITYIFCFMRRLYQLYFIASKKDIIFFQKAVIPKVYFTFCSHLKKNGKKIVYDVDDAVYTYNKDNSSRIAFESDVVICGNATLQTFYSQYCDKCFIIPTVENTEEYIPYWNNTFNEKIIGWIGSKTTIDNLDLIIDSLNRLIKKHDDIKFYIISNDDKGYCEKIKNSKFIKWEKNTYKQYLAQFSIGVMPLKLTEMTKGKCGFKLVQYLNMKKPVIGSDVGVNKSIIGSCGIVISNQNDWENALESLLYNENLYNKFINNIDNDFLQRYSFDTVSNELIKLLIETI
ncbi:glycosyltransferase [[Clostridium] spiroforme]|nr:glycosyltransferase [Thomasclavelia spiroformis]